LAGVVRMPEPYRSTPPDHRRLTAAVTDVLRDFVRDRGAEIAGLDAELTPFVDLAEQFLLGGGKRLRPAFCYWGWRGAGGEPGPAALTAAAALELVHACALVHDDVMDDSDTRRGAPSAHRRFAAIGASARGPVAADAFGRGAAVLLGDLFLVWADEMLTSCGLPPDSIARAWPLYARMRSELVAGQYLDLLGSATVPGLSGGAVMERALRVARLKTAGYTVARPLELGGTLAGAPPDLLAAYAAYGGALGEAYQLRDDLLSVCGVPDHTGKPASDDLRAAKPTALVAEALRRLDPAARARARALLAVPERTPDDVETLRRIIVGSGAPAAVEARITTAVDAAIQAVAVAGRTSAGLSDPARAALLELAARAAFRAG